MENPQWPAKHQQSVATGLESTDDGLNNGNGEHASSHGTESEDKAANDDAENHHDEAPKPNTETQPVNTSISEKAKQLIQIILEHMKELTNTEKYLLYLKLFQITTVVDPLRQPLNPLGSRSEINRTISWIKTHLEEDPDISLPKQEVYDEYSGYCCQNNIKSLSQADFGKVMKQVYPNVKARRLGTRGNSKYCYSGLRRCMKLKPPVLPDLGDKPLSTEAPSTPSSLTAAAWLIVKEWSEQHFSTQFSSLQALAYYLVINYSIGVGTDAAHHVTSASDVQKKESVVGKNGSKHREMQLQLQKKIQQKNEVKERKRKTQSPKCDNSKKSKQTTASNRQDTSPTLTGVEESSTSTSTGTGSTSTSPTQGKTICDKSQDFTQVPPLPDFKSFQKPICDQGSPPAAGGAAKVPIPRLSGNNKAQQRSPQPSPKKQIKNAKYKAIQPKPQPCDIASYNPQPPADIRSQGVHNVDRFKERKSSDDCDASIFPLPRERLNSISNVDKDAMDEYLGTSNSQHEEELSKYFGDNVGEPIDQDNTTKLSQLRQLLEENGISDSKSVSVNVIENNSSTILPNPPISAMSIQNVISYIAPVQNTVAANLPTTASQARRRVSFETPHPDDTVPPSPNTRRKNFSFTPISPGPQSPNGRQSKCSSTNVSPFVSPRNTPVPRIKNNMHQNAGIMVIGSLSTVKKQNAISTKIKKEPDLSFEIPNDSTKDNFTAYMPMSAPASPMLNSNESVLQKLLNNKTSYRPDYINPSIKLERRNDVGEIFKTETVETVADMNYRSQSVPLHQMTRTNFDFMPTLTNQSANDFNDFDSIPETANVAVANIISTLDEQQCESNNIDIYNVDINATSQCLPGFSYIVNNNTEMQNFRQDSIIYSGQTPASRNLERSQSIDVNNGCYELKCNPSRSVPNTPLPFSGQVKPILVKNVNGHSSRSHPSTPRLISESPFNYNINGDCLLNGQPIRTNGVAGGSELTDNLTYYMPNLNEINDDNNIDRHLSQEDEFSIGRTLQSNDFGIVENENGLMDEHCVLIGEQNYNGNIAN